MRGGWGEGMYVHERVETRKCGKIEIWYYGNGNFLDNKEQGTRNKNKLSRRPRPPAVLNCLAGTRNKEQGTREAFYGNVECGYFKL
jgi:hypothetical protein